MVSLKETMRWTLVGLLALLVVSGVLLSKPGVARAEEAAIEESVEPDPGTAAGQKCKLIGRKIKDLNNPNEDIVEFTCQTLNCPAPDACELETSTRGGRALVACPCDPPTPPAPNPKPDESEEFEEF